MKLESLALVASLMWALSPSLALAQTAAPAASPAATKPAPKPPAAKPAAKPATKPAAKPASAATDGKTLSFGGSGDNARPLLTRDELRACFQQEESIRVRLGELDTSRKALDQEKLGVTADQQTLRAERVPVDEWKRKADDFAVRYKAFAAEVEGWNKRVAELNEEKSGGSQWNKRRDALNVEREAIEPRAKAFEAEKAEIIAGSKTAVAAYNVKAQALDARVADWNARNTQWNAASVSLETERQAWVAACADRRYREDDENAIRRGQ